MKIPTLKNVYDPALTEATSNNYPYGRLRCSAKWWIEDGGKKGQRVCFQTINPKTGRVNAPKKSTYDLLKVLFVNPENGHVESDGLYGYHGSTEAQKFLDKYEFREQDEKLLQAFITRAIKMEEHFAKNPVQFVIK